MSSKNLLTKGAVSTLFSGQTDSIEPVLQILEIKKMNTKTNDTKKDRFRIIISDGINFMQSMVGSKLGDIDVQNDLKLHSLVKVLDCVTNNIQNRKFLIILRLEVVDTSIKEVLGKPVSIEKKENSQNDEDKEEEKKEEKTNLQSNNNNKNYNNNEKSRSYEKPKKNSFQSTILNEDDVIPIGHLNPFTSNWVIKGRVTSKSAVKSWDKGPTNKGTLMSVDLCDESNSEIRAVFFKAAVDKFQNLFVVGHIYLISNGKVKNANTQFSNVKNAYEMTLDENSVVQLCDKDDKNIPKMKYNLVKIESLGEVKDNTLVDILGIIEKVDDPSKFKTKIGKETEKQTITISDNGNNSKKFSIEVTFWDDHLSMNQSFNIGSTIICKSAKKSNYKGVSLNMSINSSFVINPDIKENDELVTWYKKYGNSNSSQSLSVSTKSDSKNKWVTKTINELKTENLGENAAEFFTLIATVTFIKKEGNLYYEACTFDKCSKKVTIDNGEYTCKTCGRQDSCKKRYILSVIISDDTGHTWCTAFNESATTILENTEAEELIKMKSERTSDFDELIDRCNFKQYLFGVKIDKPLISEKESKNITISMIKPIDFVKSSKKLLETIEKL